MRVSWFTLESLTLTIGRAEVDASINRVVTRICRSELIVIDDNGQLPAGQDAAEAFYRLVDAAYERRSVAVTLNLHPLVLRHDHGQSLATATVDPAHAPRARGRDRRRLTPIRRGPRRQGSGAPRITPLDGRTRFRPPGI